jgi:hypothetical protein
MQQYNVAAANCVISTTSHSKLSTLLLPKLFKTPNARSVWHIDRFA